MRRLAGIPGVSLLGVGVLVFLCASALPGQNSGFPKNPLLAPLQTGSLTVWIVAHNPNPRTHPKAGQASAGGAPQYEEKTMGEFGQTAGSVGQTAGSVGQTAGSFGDTAGSVGQTAGSTGQTAGGFGRSASSVGKNAGDAGQTMGNFGVSTTDLPAAAAAANTLHTEGPGPKRDERWANVLDSLQQNFPRLQVQVVDVFDDELQTRLEAAAGTTDAPDLLLGNPLPAGWSPWNSVMAEKYGLVPLGMVIQVPQSEDDVAPWRRPAFDPEAAILNVRGQAPDAARAFYVWLEDEGDHAAGNKPEPGDQVAVAAIAMRAVRSALQGEAVGPDGDAQMARFDSQQFRNVLDPTGQGKYLIDVPAERVINGFAIVAVRAVESLPQAFGMVHALAVLRKDATGRWRLLQLSPFLTRKMQGFAYLSLLGATEGRENSNPLGNEGRKPLGISQAAPQDGDTRSPQPELWWDNLGGASLQVVEWAAGTGASNLFFVKDNNPKLRTRVVARFALGGKYRWRVWSVGVDGTVVLSPWRTLTIVAG